jgi:protein SCO1/2
MSPTPRPLARRWLVLLASGAAVAAGAAVALRYASTRAASPVTLSAAVYPAPRPLPEFVLATQAGARFERAELRGRWTLLTFGFSNCPDACPTTLTELALANRELATLPPGRAPRIVFVSVDPARDTPARLANYLPQFDRRFIGLTGAAATLEELERAFGAAAIIGRPVDGSYSVEHTSAVYLIDPDARLAAVFPAPQVARTLAADYVAIVAARDGG